MNAGEELPLFAHAYARHSDPDTSHWAAALVNATWLQLMVLRVLRRHPGGCTTHEIEDESGLAAGSVTPRMKPLEKLGLVIRTDERRVPVGHKRPQIVWRIREVQDHVLPSILE
jgi:hypothetical protein